MKTSKKEFRAFIKSCLKWRSLLGLTEYKLYFKHRVIDDAYANISIDCEGRTATIGFSSIKHDGFGGSETHAKHEMLELLMGQMDYLCRSRHVMPGDIEEARHAVIRRLEHVL